MELSSHQIQGIKSTEELLLLSQVALGVTHPGIIFSLFEEKSFTKLQQQQPK